MPAGSRVQKPRLAVLVNMIAPYRQPLFEALSDRFKVTVVEGGIEPNRKEWKERNETASISIRTLRPVKVRKVKKSQGGVFDYRFIDLNPGYMLALWRMRPAAIFSSEMGFRTLCALVYGTLTGCPVSIWSGGTRYTEAVISLPQRLVRGIVKRWARSWITVGSESTNYLLSQGVRRDRILQVQNCVDESLYSPSVEPSLDLAPRPVLLYVGQLIGRKGVDKLLGVCSDIQRSGLSFTTLLVGQGPEAPRLKQLVEELGLRNVEFQPPQRPEAMPAIYRSADFLVLPTLVDMWGLVVNEALLSGLPVICSKYAGCSADLLDPINVFNPHDKEDFAKAVRRALAGEIAPATASQMKSIREVADEIGSMLAARLGSC